MPVVSGLATDYLDLLDKVRSFVTDPVQMGTQAWTVKRWQNSGAPANNELILVGSGLAGADEIYIGVSGYFNAAGDYYNWRLNGFTAYTAGPDFQQQAGSIPLVDYPPVMPSWNSPITYWLVANGRRIVLVTKISTRYEAMYLGLLQPYATPGQYPYPLFVGGSMTPYSANRWSDDTAEHRHFVNPLLISSTIPAAARLRKSDGTWGVVMNYNSSTYLHTWPYYGAGNEYPTSLEPQIDGQYTLWPIQIFEEPSNYNTYGELEGCYYLTGFDNAAENVVTISGADYLVVQNVYRTGVNQYWALKLA